MGFEKRVAVSADFKVVRLIGDRLLLCRMVEADLRGMYAVATLNPSTINGALGRNVGVASLPTLSEAGSPHC